MAEGGAKPGLARRCGFM